jgi:hypothetical protein
MSLSVTRDVPCLCLCICYLPLPVLYPQSVNNTQRTEVSIEGEYM